jgi:hypothetical protein
MRQMKPLPPAILRYYQSTRRMKTKSPDESRWR